MAEDSEGLSMVLKERAVELFNLCDRNGKGFITEPDLMGVISQLELPLDSKQVNEAFLKLDEDQNGRLTLEEFAAGFGLFLGIHSDSESSDLEEIVTDPGRELFYLCDPDKKGYITKSDLERVATDLNLNFNQLDVIFDKLDQDANGQLTIDEFAEGFGKFLNGEAVTPEGSGSETETKEVMSESDVIFESIHGTDETRGHGTDEALFRDVVESVGEDIFSGTVSRDQLKDLWQSLRKNDVQGLQKFEDFLSKVSAEIRRAHMDSEQLETALKSKMNSHDTELQKLYEEMEQQIRAEKERVHREQEKREKTIKSEMLRELERKDTELQKLIHRQKMLEQKIREKADAEQEIKNENEMLYQKTVLLEEQLTDSVSSLEDTKSYVHHLQSKTKNDTKVRAMATLRVTEGMKREQESLIKQLDMLRDLNQKLRDDKDAIEAAHQSMLMSKHKRCQSLGDEIEEAEKKTKVSRQGSRMSKYLNRPPRSSSSSSWGKQGPVQSTDEEDGPSSGREPKRKPSKRRSKRMNYFPNSRDDVFSDPLLHAGEAEFEGDVELGRIAEEGSSPAWAKNILSVVKAKETNNQDIVADGEEDVFRDRKHKILAGDVIEEEMTPSSEFSASSEHDDDEETGDSESSDRPTSPRAAPVGTDADHRYRSPDHRSAGSKRSAFSSVEMSTPERVFKVVFVGDSGVGKSSFIHRFCEDVWKSSFTATIGVDFQIKTMNVNGRCIAIQLWDTAGQERFRSITKQYFRKADGVLVLYDVTMETSFINIKEWMTSVEEGAEGSVVMVIGNKLDLVESDDSRLVKPEDGEKLAKSYDAFYAETSAKTGDNIQESMLKFAEALQEREDELIQSVLNLKDVSPAQKNKCCKSS